MEIERAFKAPFLDQKWYIKALWAGLWAGLIVTAPAVSGYSLDYLRNVAYGYETPLPEWNTGFGRWWVRGLLVGIAGLIYMLPAIVIVLVGTIPLIAGVAASASSYGGDAANAAALLGSSTICITSFLAVVYSLGVSVFFYAAYVNYALSEDFGALFQFKDILARLRTVGAGYFNAWGMSIVISFGASFVAGIAGSILGGTVVLAPLAGFVGGAIGFVGAVMTSHLFGQYAAKAYGLPGLAPVYAAPAGYTAAYPPSPVAPAPYPAYPPAAPAAPAAPAQPAPPAPAPADAPIPPAPLAHSEPVSPVPPYSPEQAAPPSGPASDPPAEDGGE